MGDVEVWRDIQGYEGMYRVSDLGRVHSLDRYSKRKNGDTQWVTGRILKQTLRNKYMRVILAGHGKNNHQSIHRLVAKAFIPNSHNKEYVNHIDGDKLNNHVSNLEWLTPLENSQDARRNGYYRFGETHLQSKVTKEEAKEILDLYYIGGFYQAEIAPHYNVEQTTISKIVRRESWHFKDVK